MEAFAISPCDPIAISNLASAFQLVAGAALAVSVFRAPYEAAQNELADRIKIEEQILVNRHGKDVERQTRTLAEIRSGFGVATKDLEIRLAPWEHTVWAVAAAGGVGLLATSAFPDVTLPRWLALATCIALFGLPIVALARTSSLAKHLLEPTKSALKRV